MIMHGWLCLASAKYLKHCHLHASNAPQLHIQRAHHQSMVSIQATCNIPLLPPQPETMGWSKGNGTLVLTVIPLAQMCRSHHMYADYTQVYIELSQSDTHKSISSLSDCLTDISLWMKSSKLTVS